MFQEQGADLTWLLEVLWQQSSLLRLHTQPSFDPGFVVIDKLAILPNRQRPRLLLPLNTRRAAAVSMQRRDWAMGPFARCTRGLLAVGLRLGMVQPLLRQRLWITASRDLSIEQRRQVVLKHHLQEVLGRRDLEFATTFGPRRANRKPVLQLMTRAGETVCYVKVGMDGLTRRLVDNEALVLSRIQHDLLRAISVPRLMYHGEWRSYDIAVLSALPHHAHTASRDRALLSAVREIADIGGREQAPLSLSPYWLRLNERVCRCGVPAERDVLRDVLCKIGDRFRDTPLVLASWHGDFAPWNVSWAYGKLLVWDWERSGDQVPLGLDLVHFYFQSAYRLRRKSAAASVDMCRKVVLPTLTRLDVHQGSESLILILYLLEIYVRYDEDRNHDLGQSLTMVCSQIVDVLRQQSVP